MSFVCLLFAQVCVRDADEEVGNMQESFLTTIFWDRDGSCGRTAGQKVNWLNPPPPPTHTYTHSAPLKPSTLIETAFFSLQFLLHLC